MLSVKKVKELLKDKNTTEKEAEEIRDGCRNLAEVIFEHWKNSLKHKKENEGKTEK